LAFGLHGNPRRGGAWELPWSWFASAGFWFRAALWTAIALMFLLVSAWFALAESRALALTHARDTFLMDQAYRVWITQLGEPVVPSAWHSSHLGRGAGPWEPPTGTGALGRMGVAIGEVRHLTALAPLRPEDAPDPWERAALARQAREVEALLADKTKLASLKIPDPLGGGRMHNSLKGLALYKERVGKEMIVEGWVEGPIAEGADLRGINTLMLDFFAGWTFPRHLYTSDVYRVWGNLPYEEGDYLTDGVLDMVYPGYQNASYFHDESGFIAPTPYGDMADCLLGDAPAWLLARYPLLVIAGELGGGAGEQV